VVLGLPGNPVSALVSAHLFLLPLVRHLMGAARPFPALVPARAGAALAANGVRRDFMRATLDHGPDGPVVTPFDRQDSAMLRLAAAANCLLVRPEQGPALAAGATVPVLML
jgi:molybdopterin molybdotransferase